MRANSFCFILLTLLLTACGTAEKSHLVEGVTVVQTASDIKPQPWPEVQPPAGPFLTPWEYDIPRDVSAPLEVRNTTACKSIPAEKRDELFWVRCGLHPADPNSNLLLGFTSDQWQIFLKNQAALEQWVADARERFRIVNAQRARDRPPS